MIVELRVSQANERVLREQGAVDPPDEVYTTMRWAYPGAFVAMAVEGIVRGAPFRRVTLAGIALLLASKALKTWAIVSLGAPVDVSGVGNTWGPVGESRPLCLCPPSELPRRDR